MKKHLYFLSIALLICGGLAPKTAYADCGSSCETSSSSCQGSSCDCKITGKTFLTTRGFFDDPTAPPKISLIRQAVQELPADNGSLFQVVPFGGKSTNSDHLAWYFGPSCKRVLTVASAPGRNVDILAEQLGIYTVDDTFESNICISPEQTFSGVGFNYRTHFGCSDENRGFFLDVTLPVYSVNNTMNLGETVIDNGGGVLVAGGPANVTEAFKQPSWEFGRIDDCCNTRKTGISMLDIQLGYGWGKEQAHMHSYIGVIIPTGNKVHSQKVFEPIVGWNHHTAVHFGSSIGIKLWESECGERTIWYELAIDSRYFFENTQCRSFDLKGKPWSRYMTVYANRAQAEEAFNLCTAPIDPADCATVAVGVPTGLTIGTPGINIFTQPVKVLPRFQRSYNTAFVIDLKNVNLEGGYNFFSRDQECVKLACPWEQLVGITSVKQADGSYLPTDGPALKAVLQGCGCTNAIQTIGNPTLGENTAFENYAENIITADQIDFSSAEAPCLLSHWLYGAIGYTIDCNRVRTLIGFGGGYEFAGDNAGLNRWGAWGKLAVIF
jgi:hypothetical protein